MARLDPAYGGFRPALWWAGVRDRLGGRGARARARWGRLRPPLGTGPVVWLIATGAREDVQVAVALMQALREERSDTRLVLTYQREYPEVLEEGLRGLRNMGFGYGPCDARRAVRRVLRRLTPRAVIAVGDGMGPRLARALQEEGVPLCHFGGDDRLPGAERFPRAEGDPLTLLTPAQVEPTLRRLVGGEAGLWWWHGPVERGLLALWRKAERSGVLVVSGDSAWARLLRKARWPHRSLEAWDRTREAQAPGTVLVADHPRWWPAVAVSADAIHLARGDRPALWAALASGRPLTRGADVETPEGSGVVTPGAEAVMEQWRRWRSEPFAARALGDELRRLFWSQRRAAQVQLQTLRERYRHW